MPIGTISSSADTVGVCVVNYPAPILATREEVLDNCNKIADTITGLKRGYPGLDLVIFPEYSTQGFHPLKWADLTTTLDGPEVKIFSQSCIDNGVWGIFSLTGEEHPDPTKNPYNTLIMINEKGETVHVYRKIFPWVPKEPWTAGHETSVAVGPKGLIIGGSICYDCNMPELVRDIVMKGAELVVRIQGYMYPAKEAQINVAKVRAWENNCYIAVANMAGRDMVYSYFGHSNIVNFDGQTLGECGESPNEATYCELSISAIRNARRNWTAENHVYNLLHRGYTGEPAADGTTVGGGHAACPFDFYKTWVNAPEKAKAISEALTRDTDDPKDATCEDVPVMAPSRLAKKMVMMSNGNGNGHAAANGNGYH
jgi:amidase